MFITKWCRLIYSMFSLIIDHVLLHSRAKAKKACKIQPRNTLNSQGLLFESLFLFFIMKEDCYIFAIFAVLFALSIWY